MMNKNSELNKNFELNDTMLGNVNGGLSIGGTGEGYTWKLVSMKQVDVTITDDTVTAVNVLESIMTKFTVDEAGMEKLKEAAMTMDAEGVKVCHIILKSLNLFAMEVVVDSVNIG